MLAIRVLVTDSHAPCETLGAFAGGSQVRLSALRMLHSLSMVAQARSGQCTVCAGDEVTTLPGASCRAIWKFEDIACCPATRKGWAPPVRNAFRFDCCALERHSQATRSQAPAASVDPDGFSAITGGLSGQFKMGMVQCICENASWSPAGLDSSAPTSANGCSRRGTTCSAWTTSSPA